MRQDLDKFRPQHFLYFVPEPHVQEAHWSAADKRWHIMTDKGGRFACRYLVMCTGNLSIPKEIPFPGIERFKGEWYMSNRWPHHNVSYAGKRVASVGTGSSGVQAVRSSPARPTMPTYSSVRRTTACQPAMARQTTNRPN